MSRFVKFGGAPYVPGKFTLDGVAGTYLSTEDINLLDADTAHRAQGRGFWTAGTVEPDAAMAMGYSHFFSAGAGTSIQFIQAASDITVLAGSTEYSTSVEFRSDEFANVTNIRLQMQFREGGANGTIVSGGFVDVDDAGVVTATVTGTSDVTTDSVNLILEVRRTDAFVWHVGSACLRAGADATFVPSLRIVGTLFEDKVDAAMPLAYAADGTPLTLGVLWAGDAVHYRRYDGADASAPLVAGFTPDDYLGGAGIVPDLSTFNDTTGREWTTHGGITNTLVDYGDSVVVEGLTIPTQTFIVKDPVGMPDEIDGARWVVGAGWIGDGYKATMHQGNDALGPIVAQFDAEDIGL